MLMQGVSYYMIKFVTLQRFENRTGRRRQGRTCERLRFYNKGIENILTMNAIRILPEKVASQIAAGEVVDRPASVVRELVDNSLDAGADRITISIQNGGKALIKVADNGEGMSRDDLLLSVERHATSKIKTASDLFSVKSLGFRGEALPSIASVSKMQIISRPRDLLAGHKLMIYGGKLGAIEEAGTPSGTIVEVQSLFYNVPARRKFLRTTRTETRYIIDVITRVALPFPAISFQLNDAEKSIMNLPASNQQLHRLSVLMGRNFAESVTEYQGGNSEVMIRAYLAPSDLARTRGDRLFIYVNSRNIRDRLVTKAIMEGYGQRLMKGQYPQAVIFMKIDPLSVDVNVHPTKQEVRFRNSRAVFDTVASVIQKALASSSHTFFGPVTIKEKGIATQAKDLNFMSEPVWHYSERGQDVEVVTWSEEGKQEIGVGDAEVIGQLGNTYILCQTKDGFLMVDQHAAHERIVYENLKKGFSASQIERQTLLIPHKLELSAKEKQIVLEKGGELCHVGIELEHFGGSTFLLRSVPTLLRNVKWDVFISELIGEIEEGKLEDDSVLDSVLTVMACHGAIRAGYHMAREEMSHLLRQLEEMELPTNCPHGRPTFKHFTYYEIEKMFKRVV